MVQHTNPGNRARTTAFTLIELLIVLLLIALLASAVMPTVVGSVKDAKESALKENLKVIREAIDDYYTDNARYPTTLDILVTKRYLRKIPVDPISDDSAGWVLQYHTDGESRGIIDVHSASTAISSNKTPYSEW